MAQLNDLLVMGQSTLLGPVTVKGTIIAEKYYGDGSGLENVSAVEVLTKAEFDALTNYKSNTLYCIIG
jgi:hypothetical protein